MNKPKVLLLDIETKPLKVWAWSLGEQHIGLDQICEDWSILSWSAKWLTNDSGEVFGPHAKIMYMDRRQGLTPKTELRILKAVWKLLDQADIVITQNGKSFDIPKLNARFQEHKLKPPSSFKQMDTLQIARKNFSFTSNKLAYVTDKFCSKYKKLEHKKFPGLEMWIECINGNKAAWEEMEKYNKHDVLGLEEWYNRISPWDSSINFSLYSDTSEHTCKCGSKEFKRNGYAYTAFGKFQRHSCIKCGSEWRDKTNLFSKDKKKSLKTGVVR